jgi:PcfJ-like protein
VSSAELFVRHQKRQTDRAISEAYSHLGGDPRIRQAFSTLLDYVRMRSARLFEASLVDGRHPGVAALFHLSRFAGAYIRPLSTWGGCDGSWRSCVNSLAQHLVAQHPVPRFLAAAWHATEDPFADAKRQWFIAHASGRPFRSLPVPITMTKRMEHVFLTSPDHLTIECAMRRAELIGLGATDALVEAVLSTPVGVNLTGSASWRPVWLFLIAHEHEIGLHQIGPIVDFIQARRGFCIRGRTPASLLRLIEEWHRNLGLVTGGVSWNRSRIRPMVHSTPASHPNAPPVIWEFVELTDSAQLKAESLALKHCVASYAHSCCLGRSRIWSLRSRRAPRVRSIVTIEIDPKRHEIVQARGFRNRLPSGRTLEIMRAWAAQENLRIVRC